MKKTLWITGVVMLISVTTFFFARNALLHYAIDKVQQKFSRQYDAVLQIEEPSISGIMDVSIRKMVLISPHADTLLTADSLLLSPRLSGLAAFNIRFDKIDIQHSSLLLARDTNGYNFAFLLKRKKNADSLAVTEKNYGQLFKKLFNASFGNIPDELSIGRLNARYAERNDTLCLNASHASLDKDELSCQLRFHSNYAKPGSWTLKGLVKRGEKALELSVYPAGDSTCPSTTLPFIDRHFDAIASFDTAYLSISSHSSGADVFSIGGNARLAGFVINHAKLSTQEIRLNHASFEYQFNIGKNYIEVDSSSTASVNAISLKTYVYWQPKPLQTLGLSFQIPSMPANDFFASLPEGMFSAVRGMQADGNLSYSLRFRTDLKSPDSVMFASSMHKADFKIKQYGAENLSKINGSFSYTAYEKGVPVKTFIVGPENPDFCPLWQIPAYLGNALLNSEDGSFFGHRGFNEDAFRASIAENLKKGRFARGGSTISMQLIKNVFLSRNKTIARKAEEALIVWLIENNGISSKDRMYEVYLNIIEWGPHIYGIKDAARFYFNKQPMQLNLAECIFLASIVPRPKGFMWSFDGTGHLRADLAGYYRIISGILLRKGQISQAEYDNLLPDVRLSGPAQYYLKIQPGGIEPEAGEE